MISQASINCNLYKGGGYFANVKYSIEMHTLSEQGVSPLQFSVELFTGHRVFPKGAGVAVVAESLLGLWGVVSTTAEAIPYKNILSLSYQKTILSKDPENKNWRVEARGANLNYGSPYGKAYAVAIVYSSSKDLSSFRSALSEMRRRIWGGRLQ